MTSTLDRDRLIEAFELLGTDLAARGAFVELAVYGGGALMLQFAWRRTTEDLDAVVREGFDEAALAPSVRYVAERMGLTPDWLNDAVGAYTPLDEDDALFEASGSYPTGGAPGLRTFIARPCYLLAMKLQALASLDRGNRDLDDARAPKHRPERWLPAFGERRCENKERVRRPGSGIRDDARARYLGLGQVEDLHRIYRSIYDEAPPAEAQIRFAAVLADPAP